MKRVAVISTSLGDLALAMRLRAAGLSVVLIDGHAQLGGSYRSLRRAGFCFERTPTFITQPDVLVELCSISGEPQPDLDLCAVETACRFSWPDGAHFDYVANEAGIRAEVARFAPGDLAGFQDILAYAELAEKQSGSSLAFHRHASVSSNIAWVAALARLRVWRSAYSEVSSHISSERLRAVLSLPVMLTGKNPMCAGALHLAVSRLLGRQGLWWPTGGMDPVVDRLGANFERAGGELRLGDAVTKLHTVGARIHEVETASGWRERVDAVVSSLDPMHLWRDLLGESSCGQSSCGEMVSQKLARRPWSPGMFVLHLGVEGRFPAIAHHSVLFGLRYRRLLADIYDHGVLPTDLLIYLHHPSASDATLAPEGCSAFTAMIPVANLGKLRVDWDEIAPVIAERVIDELSRRLIPKLSERIVVQSYATPVNAARDGEGFLGSAFGLEPEWIDGRGKHPHYRDSLISNLYCLGRGARSGRGLPVTLERTRDIASLIEVDLRG